MRKILYCTFIIFFYHLDKIVGQELTPIYPKDKQVISSALVISWNKVGEANDVDYEVSVSTDSTFSSSVNTTFTNEDTLYYEPISSANYYWKVLASRNGLALDSSQVYSFNYFNPRSLDSLNLWIRADTGVTLVGDRVSSWDDLSDSNVVINQNSSSLRPLFIDSALNNLPVVDFDAVDDRLDLSVALSVGNFTISAVYNVHEKTSRGIRMLDGTFNWLMGPHARFHRVFNGGFVAGKMVVIDQYVAHSVSSFKDTTKNFVNNIFYGENVAAFPPGSSLTIGQNRLNGSIAELLIINGVSSDSNRNVIDNYLMDKYSPPVNLGEDKIVCSFPDSVELDIDYALDFQWSTGDTTSKAIIDSAGKYYVTITDMFERQSIDSIVFTQDTSTFLVNLIDDSTLCLGEELFINAGPERYNYQWNTGDSSIGILVNTTNVYKVTVEDCKGNFSEDSVETNFNQPIFSLGEDTLICFSDSIILESDSSFSNVSYNWSNSSTDSSIVVHQQGVYKLTITDATGCIFNDSVQLSVDSTIAFIDLGKDTSLCSGNKIGLINPIAGIDDYMWNTGDTDSSIIVENSQTYKLELIENGCRNSDSVFITIKGQAPFANFATDSLCFGNSVSFTDQSVDSNNILINQWKWSFGDGDSAFTQNTSHSYDTTGMFITTLEVTNDSGCVGIISKMVNVHPIPEPNFIVTQTCSIDSVSFTGQSLISDGDIVSYYWDFGDTMNVNDTSNQLNPKYKFPNFGSYSVQLKVASDSGCVDSIEKEVVINASPIADYEVRNNFKEDTVVFINKSDIDNGEILEYSWRFGNGDSSIEMNPRIFFGQVGTYEVVLEVRSDSGCVSIYQDSVEIIKRPPPRPEFNTVTPKEGQTIFGPFSFAWNEKEGADEYTLEVADGDFLQPIIKQNSVRENVTVSFENQDNRLLCWRAIAFDNGIPIDTTNPSCFKYFDTRNLDSLNLWLRADSGVQVINGFVSEWTDLSDSGKHVTQDNIGQRPEFLDSMLNHLPVLSFDATDDRLLVDVALNGENFLISAIYNVHEKSSRGIRLVDGTSNNWLMGPHARFHRVFNGGFIPGKMVVIDQYVAHSVTSYKDTVKNFVNRNFYGENVGTIRPGSALEIGANNLNGNLAEFIIVNGFVHDTIRSAIDLYLMDKYAPPVDLGPDRRVCSFPDSIELNLDYALNYTWSTGDTTSKALIDSAGKYYVTITDMFERQTVDSLFFILDTVDFKAEFDFEDSTICEGGNLELQLGQPRYEISWNTGEKVPNIIVDSAGMYKVEIRNCLGQLSTDSVIVNVNEPRFDLGVDTTVCFNQLIRLQTDSTFTNVNYQWSTGDTLSFIIADTSATYTLTVLDNFLCSFRDSINVVIDSNLYGVTLGPDTSLCEGNEITLINAPINIDSYRWSTGNIEAIELVDTAGLYTLEFGDSLCIAADTVSINVKGLAPNADFQANNFCFLDTTQFVDQSSDPINDTIINWKWSFGDGDSSEVKNAMHEYAEANNYTVSLEIMTNKGCRDIISKQITIHPKPEAKFIVDGNIACSKSPIRFLDNSTIAMGSIIGYSWNFGDSLSSSNTSNNQNPSHVFDTLGSYLVSLSVVTDQGCKDTIITSERINPTPVAMFDFEGSCLNDSTHFIDQTILPQGNVSDYLWVVSGQISLQQNPSFQFVDTGRYPVVLRVRTTEECQSTIRDTISIFENPLADFTQLGTCSGLAIDILDQSTSSDSIVSYQYIFDSRDTFSIQNPSLTIGAVGEFPLKLKVIDTNQCKDSLTKNIIINPASSAAFDLAIDEAGVPFKIELTNRSVNGQVYRWDFGDGDTSDLFEPIHTYRNEGEYVIKLVVSSQDSCIDSVSRQIHALPFLLDAAVQQLELSEGSLGAVKVRTRLINSGNNTINKVRLIADVNNDFQFRETFDRDIYRGRSETFEFSSDFIEDEGRKLDFLCLRIQEINEVSDTIEENNELCEIGFSDRLKLDVFPNPASDQLAMNFVLPEEGVVDIRFYDQHGRIVLNGIDEVLAKGFYQYQFNVRGLSPGFYYYLFSHNGSELKGTFVKQ